MAKKVAAFAGSLVLLGSLFAPSLASASSLTQDQISSILALLQSFGADASTIANVNTALGGSSAPSGSCSAFADLKYGDFDTAPGGRVSGLQTFLGIPATSFGYGTYGPKTLAAWNAQCGSAQPTLNGSADLTASPASGSSPLIVLFNAEGIDYNGQTYSVSFGDGESTNTLRDYCAAITASGCSFYHTYKSSGTYTAILKDAGGNTLATQTVTVTGNPTATNFSVSPASGSAPLAVHFSALNVWTPVVDSVATVDFGDGSSGTLGLASQTTCAAAGAAIAGACTYSTTHTYAAAGTYTAILKDAGGNTLATQTVTVTGGNQATAMQIQSIVALLKAFSATSGTIADVQAALGGQAGAQTSTPVTARQAQSIISLLRAWGIDTGVTNTVSSILGGG